MTRQGADPERVREVLRAVLEREGIPRPEAEPSALQRWLGELLDGLMSGVGGSARFLELLLVVAAAAFLVTLVLALLRRSGGRTSAPRLAGDVGEAARARVDALREEARRLAQAGELGLALRAYLVALVVGLGEHGDLELRPAWTNRELLVRGRVRPEVRDRLAELFDALEPKTFGRVPATLEDVRALDDACRRMLAGEAP